MQKWKRYQDHEGKIEEKCGSKMMAFLYGEATGKGTVPNVSEDPPDRSMTSKPYDIHLQKVINIIFAFFVRAAT